MVHARPVKPPAIFIMGPTASGKTDLAMALTQHLPCDIISVDSAQVYRGMDIGTAKPTLETLAKYPHRLIDIRNPDEPYSAAEFREDALREMAAITHAGRIPLLVGGTMLYFKTLLEGIADLPQADPALRAEIASEAAQVGWPDIHRRLMELDPVWAKEVHPNQSQRIHRAWEVYLLTGETMTALHARQRRDEFPYAPIQLALAPTDRTVLHHRIEARFHAMLAAGLVEEAKNVFNNNTLHIGLPSVRAAGYRQVWDYLSGNLSRDEMTGRAIVATRQLAKRQLTWLRGWPGLDWILSEEPFDQEKILGEALKRIDVASM